MAAYGGREEGEMENGKEDEDGRAIFSDRQNRHVACTFPMKDSPRFHATFLYYNNDHRLPYGHYCYSSAGIIEW